MAAIIKQAIMTYGFLFDELADDRIKGWLLVAKPYQVLIILVLYLQFVFKWGPKLMKNRQPYNLDRIMIIHNLIQIVCCGYIFIVGTIKWIAIYKLFCEPLDKSHSEEAVMVASLVYYYYLLKIFDLLDTVFFVLRKKNSQASFLHVYHHTGMVALAWGTTTYMPGGHGTFVGLVNCFVHVVMYSYYLLSIISPKIKKSLWLKKLVTQIQIVQFSVFVIHMGTIVFIPDCAYPRWTAAIFLPQNIFMLILFVDFYIKTYIKKPKQPMPVKNLVEESKTDDNNNVGAKEIVSESIPHIVKRIAVQIRN